MPQTSVEFYPFTPDQIKELREVLQADGWTAPGSNAIEYLKDVARCAAKNRLRRMGIAETPESIEAEWKANLAMLLKDR